MPNGVYPQLWHPDAAGSAFAFKRIMHPLEPYRDQLVTISKLRAPQGSLHLGASAAWLNGVGPIQDARDLGAIESRKTLDQYIADKVAADTPLRSMQLGTEDMGTSAGACDGFPCVFFNTLSWRDDTSPLPVEITPRVTFERMFGETGSPVQRHLRWKQKRSMLDSFTYEMAKMQRTLGPSDKAMLDSYVTNVREVEQQIDRMQARVDRLADPPDVPLGVPEVVRRPHDDHLQPAAPRVPCRHFTGIHVPDRPRRNGTRVCAHRRTRSAPQHLAPSEHAGQDRGVRQDLHLPGEQAGRVRPEAPLDAGWRRHALRSLPSLLGQRDERREPARTLQSPGGYSWVARTGA